VAKEGCAVIVVRQWSGEVDNNKAMGQFHFERGFNIYYLTLGPTVHLVEITFFKYSRIRRVLVVKILEVMVCHEDGTLTQLMTLSGPIITIEMEIEVSILGLQVRVDILGIESVNLRLTE